MCGIVGRLNFLPNETVSRDLIKKMAKSIEHRGPDDEGYFFQRNLGLGFRRLSIIDLSPQGHQPLSNEDESIWIVFNGEIYNFLDLRQKLEIKGHKFRSKTDTEVVVHLYEEKGEKCLDDLRGMFAFALWDKKKQKLFMARDRIGKKPFFYYSDQKSIIFASEIKAILKDPSVKREIDHEALNHFLVFSHISAPRSIFKQIRKVPPAHYLVVENGELRIQKYWWINFQKKTNLNFIAAKEKIVSLLKNAVSSRLIADVPLGVFLSGGYDSSLVVALMSGFVNKPIKTFSVGFKEEAFNELPFSRVVARFFNTEHYEIIIKPNIIEDLPKVMSFFDEPYSNSSTLATYYLAKFARKNVTVVLNGDGGDENFGGYDRYLIRRAEKLYSILPCAFRKTIVEKPLRFLTKFVKTNEIFHRMEIFLKTSARTPEIKFLRHMCYLEKKLKESVYRPDFVGQIEQNSTSNYIENIYNDSKTNNSFDRAFYFDLISYVPGDLLIKGDTMTMANSIESRSPLLDQEVIEFAASLPNNFKINHGERKHILKEATRHLLPPEIIARKQKYGFVMPIRKWLRHELKEYVKEILLDNKSVSRGYFEKKKMEKMLTDHIERKVNYSNFIWNLLNLELWHRLYVDDR